MKKIIVIAVLISYSINGMWHDNYFDSPAPYNPGPTPPAYPSFRAPSTKKERKASKKQENQKLMQYAHQMVGRAEDLNNPLTFLHSFTYNTLLTAAASHKCHQNIAQFALDNGADINAPDKSGNTPLKKAVTAKCAQNISYLIGRGAHLNHKLLQTICSPIWDEIAPSSTRRRLATLNTLLACGANPNESDSLVRNGNPNEFFWGTILSCLLTPFAGRLTLEGKDDQNHAAIFIDQRQQMIRILLDRGLDPFAKDDKAISDWSKIIQAKDKYHRNLFEFTQKEIEKRKIQ
ncbi:hypothetical protein BH09DEP1_BH09DEP1_4940 [soil metagenome]